ncbi:hypothetical protein QTP88_010776 [Uroleucon formosanum]
MARISENQIADLLEEDSYSEREIDSDDDVDNLIISSDLESDQGSIEKTPIISQDRSSGRCNVVIKKKNRKTAYQCHSCKRFICGEHSVRYCHSCIEDDVSKDSASE